MNDINKLSDKQVANASGGDGSLVVNERCRVWIENDQHSVPDNDSGHREGVAKVGTIFTIGAKAMDWRHKEWVQDARTGYWIKSIYVEPYNGK